MSLIRCKFHQNSTIEIQSPQDIRKGRLYCLTTAPITKGRTNELFKVKIQVELILQLENSVRQFSQQKASFTFFSHLITLFPKNSACKKWPPHTIKNYFNLQQQLETKQGKGVRGTWNLLLISNCLPLNCKTHNFTYQYHLLTHIFWYFI